LALIYLKQVKNISMKYKIFLVILFIGSTTLFTSCIKDNLKYTHDEGKTFLKFLEAPQIPLYFTPFSNIDTVDIFSTRKDANSNVSLTTPTTAILTSMPQLIDSFNSNNGTNFEMLPDSIFTLLNSSFVKTATGYTLNFASGDFAKSFTIALNGAKWNVSHTYALAFALSSTSGGNVAVSSAQDSIIVFLSVKNKYDGKYTVTGILSDAINGGITGFYPWECELQTSGPNSVQLYDPYFGAIYHAISSGVNRTVYGSFGLEITFDPVTNAVVSITNVYGHPAGNTRDALLDNTATYKWNPSNKSMDVKYYMTQSSLVPAAPHIRTTFIENFKYTGPR
jgi:hypothetical protein